MVRYPLSSPRSEVHQSIKMAKEGQKLAFLGFFQPKTVPILLSGYNAKKILTQATLAEKIQKMPINTILEPFLTILCHFDGLQPTKNLGGIVRSVGIYLLKIWKKITFPPQEYPELHVIRLSHTPQMQHNKKYLFIWKIKQHLIIKIGKIGN